MFVDVLNNIIYSTLQNTTPLMLAALGGVFCQKAKIFNIGLEGIMLVGAFSAICGVMLSGGSALFGLLFAVVCGAVFSMVFYLFSVRLKANQIITGIGLNLMASGLTAFLLRAVFDTKGALRPKGMTALPTLKMSFLSGVPVIGGLFGELQMITLIAVIMMVLTAVILKKTPTGINTIAVGEMPSSVSTSGTRINRVYLFDILWSGILCGCAGAYLSLVSVSSFTEDMVNGRGFTAFSALIFGNGNPYAVCACSLLFGFVDALGIKLELSKSAIPSSIIKMFPYILTVVALSMSSYARTRKENHVVKRKKRSTSAV
jgi:ABC-type uncharacterized transport system permease subunit